MELINAITPYLGTKTILVVDSKEHWLEIYNLLVYRKTFYEEKKRCKEN